MKKLILGLMVLTFMASSALAQGRCGPHVGMKNLIKEEFGATLKYGGINNGSNMIQIFANMDKDSENYGRWVALRTTRDGLSCVVSFGGNWTEFEETLKGDDT